MDQVGQKYTKVFTHCGEEKSIEEYYNFARSKDGKHCYCKICDDLIRVDNRLKKKYGITLKEYNVLWDSQKNLCAICGSPRTTERLFCVDHCHTTGKVRGILCIKCNSALGKFNDDVGLLNKAILYLQDN